MTLFTNLPPSYWSLSCVYYGNRHAIYLLLLIVSSHNSCLIEPNLFRGSEHIGVLLVVDATNFAPVFG
jgi:hypothetical protein